MIPLIASLPDGLVLWFASSYLAGKNAEEALSLAQRLFERDKFTSTIDILGEAARTAAECDDFVQEYIRVIGLLKESKLPVVDKREQFTLSFKPSMFCVSVLPDLLPDLQSLDDGYRRIEQIVKYAFENNVNMTIEAESHIWTDFQLDTYFSLQKAGYKNLGTVLQTRLLRTAKDLNRFEPGSRLRLVIGIYQEGSEVAHLDKKVMKELLIKYSRDLLAKNIYVEFATHDQLYVDKFVEDAFFRNIEPDKFEVQFLFGVPRYALQKRLTEAGVLVRLYLPYGQDSVAGPYCKRRLLSNPNILVYGMKNIIGLH